jgi:regulator of sirC expression with transglutaminase-like and TPR domain
LVQGAPTRHIIARMLRNLKAIFMEKGDAASALAVLNRVLVLYPNAAEEQRDRGLAYAMLECPRAAADDLEAYLTAAPDAPDAGDMRAEAARLRAAAGRLN